MKVIPGVLLVAILCGCEVRYTPNKQIEDAYHSGYMDACRIIATLNTNGFKSPEHYASEIATARSNSLWKIKSEQ